MEKILVRGGRSLHGTVRIEAAKNAVLPALAAAILSKGEVILNGVPPLHDVFTISQLLLRLGVSLHTERPGRIRIRVDGNLCCEAPYDLVRRMRASVLVMGPLLARLGKARVSLPGGCAIGNRPIDLHLKGFQALGADIRIRHGFVEAEAARLVGSRVYLDYPSHTATENIMMAAVLARGTTRIENAAEEPEVADLANFLNAMGTRVIEIEGVEHLHGAEWTCIPDRIEAGTYLVAAGIAGGEVLLENAVGDHLKPVIAKLEEAGMEILQEGERIRARRRGSLKAVNVKTLPYPGFPTDMQAPIMSLLTLAEGTSIVTESVFENRFLHVEELKRMGADIQIEGTSAIIRGVPSLTGAPVRATDLRAGAALVLAALGARGETEVTGTAHIDRGYVNLAGKLQALGADIDRVE